MAVGTIGTNPFSESNIPNRRSPPPREGGGPAPSLDTEGNDALVLQGGARTLATKVRYVEFEYGTGGAWQRIRLPAVLTPLEEVGFVCYWLGKGKLCLAGAPCWLQSGPTYVGNCVDPS